jgi:hypothetical protein
MQLLFQTSVASRNQRVQLVLVNVLMVAEQWERVWRVWSMEYMYSVISALCKDGSGRASADECMDLM